MTRAMSIGLRDRLTTLLPNRTLWTLARESGFVVRARKIEPPAFVWALVFGFAFGGERTLAGLRRAYETATKKTLVPSSFQDRFTPALVKYLRLIVGRLFDGLTEPSRALAGEFGAFKEVIATDATVIRLHDFLAKAFPGCRTNHTKAALKLHVVMTVDGNGPKSVKITSERKGDGKVLRVGKWTKDRLLLFDLGYYRYQLFDCIRRNGGYFVSRLKANANPRIVAVHRQWRGASVPLVGEKLQDVIARLIEVVEAHDGAVQEVMGDGVMALFGAPIAVEDAPLKACRAALEIHRRMAEEADTVEAAHGVRPRLRVGLHWRGRRRVRWWGVEWNGRGALTPGAPNQRLEVGHH